MNGAISVRMITSSIALRWRMIIKTKTLSGIKKLCDNMYDTQSAQQTTLFLR